MNMKYIIFIFFFCVAGLVLMLVCIIFEVVESFVSEFVDYVSYVNFFMGIDFEFSLFNGNIYLVIVMFWGMNFWMLMINKMGDGWIYQYDVYKIWGFKQIYQFSFWINDYVVFFFMLVMGMLKFQEEEWVFWFLYKVEVVQLYYYKVYFVDYDVVIEMALMERVV